MRTKCDEFLIDEKDVEIVSGTANGAIFTDTVYGLFAKEKTTMRLIEYFKVSVFRLKEFWLYTVCGIPFYRNYERFYWRKVVTIKEALQECWHTAHQAGRFEGKGIAEDGWQTFEQYYKERYEDGN